MTSINTPGNSRLPNSLETLKYIIKNGGDVNLNNGFEATPLITASGSNLANTKLLIAAGADPNFIHKTDNGAFQRSALTQALTSKRIEIANYLIFEQKVNYKIYKHSLSSKWNPGGYKILSYLREMTFEIDSENHKQKMKLVDFLSKQGLDYWSTPIPGKFKNNSGRTEEYLSKY